MEPKPWWASKLNWVGIGLLAAATLEFLAKDEMTPDWLDKILLAAAGILVIVFRTVTTQPIASRMLAWLLCATLVFASSESHAADPTIKFKDVVPGQAYEFIYLADGTATLRTIPTVVVGGSPTPVPTPTPNPTGLAAQVQALTQAALFAGGSTSTAANLAAAYSVVANQVEAGTVTPAQIGPSLKFLSDSLIPTGETAHWAKWRTGVGDLLTSKIGNKADAVVALRAVESGVKASVNASARATGAEAIDWGELFRLLLPILLRLLEKFLNPMGP